MLIFMLKLVAITTDYVIVQMANQDKVMPVPLLYIITLMNYAIYKVFKETSQIF